VNFYSDNTAPACPEILAAIAAANTGAAKGYGEDAWTLRLNGVFTDYFGTPVAVFPVATGTAANALSLATLTPPHGGVFCHRDAHIVRDECGAPEFFGAGLRLLLLDGAGAKFSPAALSEALDDNPASVHTVQPSAVSLTQATELGRVYSPAEIHSIADVAHANRLRVHMDGARFANAVAHLGCHPGDVTWRAGVDVLSFGATKNGALTAEAVVFFDQELVRDFEFRRKRSGHLLSKSRFVATQLLAYVETGVWLRNARHANALAQRIAQASGPLLVDPVEGNQVFVRLGEAGVAALRTAGFGFYDWGAARSGVARFVVSWDATALDVERLCAAITAQVPATIRNRASR